MKYIRTKNGIIYETIENGETYNGFGCKGKNGTIKVLKKDVLKQAYTIEKLCDEFVHVRKSEYLKPMLCYQMHFNPKQLTIRIEKTNDEIYGAIWTDKGLIYVAKMKGALPNGEIDWELCDLL